MNMGFVLFSRMGQRWDESLVDASLLVPMGKDKVLDVISQMDDDDYATLSELIIEGDHCSVGKFICKLLDDEARSTAFSHQEDWEQHLADEGLKRDYSETINWQEAALGL